jgi:hypothetical protein
MTFSIIKKIKIKKKKLYFEYSHQHYFQLKISKFENNHFVKQLLMLHFRCSHNKKKYCKNIQ